MSQYSTTNTDTHAQIVLENLRQTAAKTLDRKQRLGQYAIIWQNNAPVAIGDDAPPDLKQTSQTKN